MLEAMNGAYRVVRLDRSPFLRALENMIKIVLVNKSINRYEPHDSSGIGLMMMIERV